VLVKCFRGQLSAKEKTTAKKKLGEARYKKVRVFKKMLRKIVCLLVCSVAGTYRMM
jgi:hypothetical protein